MERQLKLRWMLIVVIILCCGIIYPFDFDHANLDKQISLGDMAGRPTDGFQNTHNPSGDAGSYLYRANPVPGINYELVYLKRLQPFWDKLLTVKPVNLTNGFFFSLLVIRLFSLFYQSSRTSSEGDAATQRIMGFC